MPTKYRYAEMTWPECDAAAKARKVAVLPVATYEDHGYHLPIDTDVLLATEICERAVARIPDEAVLIPAVTHGYSPHHMDFPGTITIGWDTFIRYVKDVCLSLAHHGFDRVLIVNGHGSNTSPLDMAARLTVVESEGRCLAATVNHWGLRPVREAGKEARTSGFGGTSHACEYETALYLALRPELVQMEKAVDESTPLPPSFQTDLLAGKRADGSVASVMPWWSSMTESGVRGNARAATREKGEIWLEAAILGVIELTRELRELALPARVDHH